MNEDRMYMVLDEIRGDVKSLCERMTKVETELNIHLENQREKFNKTTVIMGIIVGVIGVVAALK